MRASIFLGLNLILEVFLLAGCFFTCQKENQRYHHVSHPVPFLPIASVKMFLMSSALVIDMDLMVSTILHLAIMIISMFLMSIVVVEM